MFTFKILFAKLTQGYKGVLEKYCSWNFYTVLLISNFTNGEMDESCGSVYFPTSVNEFNKIMHQLSHGTTSDYLFCHINDILEVLDTMYAPVYIVLK